MRTLTWLTFTLWISLLLLYLLLLIARQQTPHSPWIAFQSNRNGNTELYTVRPDGSRLTRLTYNDPEDLSPSWSPDGRWIVFTSQWDGLFQLMLMRSAGGHTQVLSEQEGLLSLPDWSPDGKWIAFNLEGSLYKIDPQGGDVIPIETPDLPAYAPSWSPDSQWLIFMTSLGDFYRVPAAAGGEAIPLNVNGAGPDWSPNGEWIAFSRPYTDFYDLYLTRPDGGQPTGLGISPLGVWYPDWSPDGEWLAFEWQLDYNFNSDLYLIRPDGRQLTPLTRTPYDSDSLPAWSPIIDLPLRFGILLVVSLVLLLEAWLNYLKSN